MTLHDLSTERLRQETENFRARAANPYPWEDAKELAFQAGIRQEILTVRGVR